MPYEVRQVGDQFCVMKQGTSERMGCHPTKEKAMAQMRALYANEADMPMKAEMSGAAIDDLPDSDFAYIEPGGKKDSEGKTTPRSLRHFPIHDAAHVRNALARLDQSPFGDRARARVEAAAKRMGIGGEGKAFFDMKAELLPKRRITSWLNGETGRRILVVPFGGPIPGGKAGLDLDMEYFDDETDLYGEYKALRATNWRMMDWHHDDAGVPPKLAGGPAISMKSVVIGEIELDDDPDDFGHWAQWWIRQGQYNDQRIAAARVAALQEMGQPIYGSSLAMYKKKASDGHIEVWPLTRHTASTAPRNTHAAIPSLKAMLADDDLPLDEIRFVALKAAMLGLADSLSDLGPTFSDGAADTFPIVSGKDPAKAGRVLSAKNEAELQAAIDALMGVIDRMRGSLGDNTDA